MAEAGRFQSYSRRTHAIPKMQSQIEYKRAYNDLLPISSCPPEILIQIFLLTFPDPGRPKRKDVLLCSHICHKWRKTAWASSELWANIRFTFCYSEYCTSRGFDQEDGEMLREWLARTGNTRTLTLSIICSIYSFRYLHHCPFVEPVRLLQIVVEYSRRWKRLELCLPWTWFARLQGHYFPKLEAVEFTAFDAVPDLLTGVPLDEKLCPWTTPYLQRVKLAGVDCDPLLLPWSQLQDIRLIHTPPQGFFDILPLCQQAKNLEASIVWGRYQGFRLSGRPPKKMNLPRLERLLIQCEVPSFMHDVLDNLVAPRLQHLVVNVFRGGVDSIALAIKKFCKRAQPKRFVVEVDFDNSGLKPGDADLVELWIKMTGIPVEMAGLYPSQIHAACANIHVSSLTAESLCTTSILEFLTNIMYLHCHPFDSASIVELALVSPPSPCLLRREAVGVGAPTLVVVVEEEGEEEELGGVVLNCERHQRPYQWGHAGPPHRYRCHFHTPLDHQDLWFRLPWLRLPLSEQLLSPSLQAIRYSTSLLASRRRTARLPHG